MHGRRLELLLFLDSFIIISYYIGYNNRYNNRLGIIEITVGAVNNAIFIRREGDNNFNASLHQSVKAGNSFEVPVLLQLGANPNIKDEDEEGKYPIEIAREGGHIKVIQTLLTGGAIDSKLNDDSHTLQ